MPLPPRLDAALQRLAAALDHLEEELAVMQDDRSRLAVELDGALARSRSLAIANAEVQRKLEQVGEVIRGLLPSDEEA